MSKAEKELKEEQFKRDCLSRIRVEMVKRDWSDTDLSNITNITRATIGSYAIGRNIPNSYNLMLIADALGVSTDYLLKGDKSSYDEGVKVGKEIIHKAVEEAMK